MKIEVEVVHVVVRGGQVEGKRPGVGHALKNPTTVYEVTVCEGDGSGGVWQETLLTRREVEVFGRGLEAAASLLGLVASVTYKHVGGTA